MGSKPRANRPLDHDDGSRTCSGCRSRQPIENFDTDKSATRGRRTVCKSCRSAAMSKWYSENQERQCDRQRERFERNRDAIRQQDIKRYYRSREKRIALVADAGNRQRALRRGAAGVKGITPAALRERDGDLCCYCGVTMTFRPANGSEFIPDKATVEHVIALSRGGTHDWHNVKLACWRCNVRKNAQRLEDWLPAN